MFDKFLVSKFGTGMLVDEVLGSTASSLYSAAGLGLSTAGAIDAYNTTKDLFSESGDCK